MRIAVYGASGYTGRLVAAELGRRGIEMVLAGRDAGRLRAAAPADADAEVRTAAVDEPRALAAAFAGCAAVVNCAAPFSRLGELVARGAIAARLPYVDIAGEQPYIRAVFETLAADAERAGVPVLPAMTDDGLPGDLVAHLAAALVEPVEEVVVAHRLVSGGPSRGTLRSVLANLEAFRDGGVSYADGRWRTAAAARRAAMTFPGDCEPSPVVRFPAPEVIGIPRHTGARWVEGVTEPALAAALAAVTPELAERIPEGPDEERRRAARFTLVADATGRDGRRARGVVTGPDMYGTTAVIAVEAARRLAADGAPAGVLAAAQAFDARDFLDFLRPFGVRWNVG
jgi:short subunit dehydrogenase-like uncharacterized protein